MSPDEGDNSAGSCRQGSRLSQSEIRFSFDGDIYPAQRGDTAASALLRAGVRLFGRSIKYRRPRGVFTAGIEEPNALFTVGPAPDFIPNVPATTLVLKDGI